jgi:hypothetical protein
MRASPPFGKKKVRAVLPFAARSRAARNIPPLRAAFSSEATIRRPLNGQEQDAAALRELAAFRAM